MIDSLHSKKAGEEKGEPSVRFRDQRGAVLRIENQENIVICTKTLKKNLALQTRGRVQKIQSTLEHAIQTNPNTVICTKNA